MNEKTIYDMNVVELKIERERLEKRRFDLLGQEFKMSEDWDEVDWINSQLIVINVEIEKKLKGGCHSDNL